MTLKPLLYDIFCCQGGATKGYQNAGFRVIGVDDKPQRRYCGDDFILMDALEFLDRYLFGEYGDAAAFHASPPCQAYMDIWSNGKNESKHPRLIEPVRRKLIRTGKPFIIENVHKSPLNAQLMLCGTMFGLHVIRHRYFEASFTLPLSPFTCNHWGTVAQGDFAACYARGSHGKRHGPGIRDAKAMPAKITKSEAMGIDWMDDYGLNQAIPPAYTEYIGKYLFDFDYVTLEE